MAGWFAPYFGITAVFFPAPGPIQVSIILYHLLTDLQHPKRQKDFLYAVVDARYSNLTFLLKETI
jgi:hypothetical protein